MIEIEIATLVLCWCNWMGSGNNNRHIQPLQRHRRFDGRLFLSNWYLFSLEFIDGCLSKLFHVCNKIGSAPVWRCCMGNNLLHHIWNAYCAQAGVLWHTHTHIMIHAQCDLFLLFFFIPLNLSCVYFDFLASFRDSNHPPSHNSLHASILFVWKLCNACSTWLFK